MPIKLSDEVRTQFDTNLSTIKKFNAKDLIRRDELGSELNFADAETDFETAINLFKGLADIDIMRVPEWILLLIPLNKSRASHLCRGLVYVRVL